MTSGNRYLGQTKLHSLLTPQRKFLDTKRSGNVVPFRSPYQTKMKESVITNITSSRNNDLLTTPYRKQSDSYLDFTPNDSKNYKTTNTNDRFYPRTINKTLPHQQKLQKTLKTTQTFSQLSQENGSYQYSNKTEQLEKLRKENQDLKRKLSLKTQCSCQAPYVQQQVEYLRHHFYQHIQRHHKEQQKRK